MNIRFAFVVSVVLFAAGTCWSQSRLGEVAGSIKLNPEAIVEQEGFVEDREAAEKEDHELLGSALAGCSATADTLGSLIDEARNTILYRDDELPIRLSATSLELETRLLEIDLLRLSDVFAESAAAARGAVEFCNAGAGAVREELARRGVAFTRAKDEITRCRHELHRAEDLLEAVDATPDAGPGTMVDADEFAENGADDAIVATACEAARGEGEGAFDACAGRQYRALAALETRTPENELIDTGVFEGIRRICTELHPADFDQRNACEIERMTATRLESE